MSAAKIVFVLGMSLFSLAARADTVRIDHPWIGSTAPGQDVAGAYMDLTADADMALVGVESRAAKTVQLHRMAMKQGVMIMRPVKEIQLPKGKTVHLKPGGLHVMLVGLNGQIRRGDKTRIVLVVLGKGGKEYKIPVEAVARANGGMTMR